MKFAYGVVTNTTQYNKTERDVQRIADIVQAFEFGKYTGKAPDHAFVCGKKLKGACVTFGRTARSW